jgi:fructose-1,6-bisphosphatase/inositol monophosphatase family enzyme
LTSAPTWIIDPIDGTTNFVHGFHITCISVALSIEREVVIGIVYNPILDQMFTAIKGHGAYLNNIQINTSKTEGKELCPLTISSLSALKRLHIQMHTHLRAHYQMKINQQHMFTGSQNSKEQFLEHLQRKVPKLHLSALLCLLINPNATTPQLLNGFS